VSNIHWDYADSFSGRDAAYLIAGFDPSSISAEQSYKVQPIIKKLKSAYYFACAEVRRDVGDDEYFVKKLSWVHLHKYNCQELLSENLEKIIRNFMASEFVANGYVQKLDTVYSYKDFPKAEVLSALENKNDEQLQRTHQIVRAVDPKHDDMCLEIERYYDATKAEERKFPVGGARAEVQFPKRFYDLWDKTHQIVRNVDPAHEDACWAVAKPIVELLIERDEWKAINHAENNRLRKECEQLYLVATRECREWLTMDAHEFDDQRFSRSELHRWVTENNLSSEYQFAHRLTPIGNPEKVHPWGSHSTILLEKLSKAAIKWWGNYDPSDITTAPTNEEVTAWLVKEGVTNRIAQAMSTILRADGLQTGRRG
jgi:hypothetical protein